MRRVWPPIVAAVVVIAACVATCVEQGTGPAPAPSAPEAPRPAPQPAERKRGATSVVDAAPEQPSEPTRPSAAARAPGVVETAFDPPDSKVATPRHGLRGRVIDLRGRPVAGADVALVSLWLPGDVLHGLENPDIPTMTSRVTTGADGRFTLSYHEGGERELRVTCGDFREWSGRDLGDDREHEVVLPDSPRTVIVRVTSADDGAPIPVAGVVLARVSPDKLDSERSVSRDDPPEPGSAEAPGVFRIECAESGPALLDVYAPGFAQSLGRSVLVPVEGELTVDVALRRGLTVRGQVVDAASGRGVADVCVRLGRRFDRVPYDDANVEAWTDADGRFVLEHVPLRPTEFVTFVARQFGPRDDDLADQEFLVGTTDAAAGEIEVVVRLRNAAGARVRCLDADGRAVANALVALFSDHDATPPGGMRTWETSTVVATTGADGRATLTGIHPGSEGIELRTRFHVDGVAVLERTFPPLGAGETRDLGDVVLGPTLALRGTVVDADGKPVAGASVVAAPTDADDPHHAAVGRAVIGDGGRRAESGPDGAFTLPGLSPGLWDVYASTGFGTLGHLARGVDVKSGAVTLRLPRSVALAGRVVDAHGSPVKGACVGVTTTDFFGMRLSQSCVCAEDGRFAIEGFADDAAEADVEVRVPGTETTSKFRLRPGTPDAELRLR